MRWESQSVEAEHDARLPGFSEDVVIRRFDAPEALDTRFHEIRTKSAINHVPGMSRVPFEWTVNPYRGCSHACSYCQSGDTRILMADGTHRALEELRAGDEIYGTVRRGVYRRFTRTRVLAHWSSIKRAYRVTLADGTELVASADHRYLTRRGWKHVIGTESGSTRRPHLTIGSELMGVGMLHDAPTQDTDYLVGYLCGMVRGDAHLGSSSSLAASGRTLLTHRFRLALVDGEALERTRSFLESIDVRTHARVFALATATRREISSIATASYERVERIREVIQWPHDPSDSWRKGFLAGIFDAEGGCSDHAIRISNTDPEILSRTSAALTAFGFDHVIEPPAANGVRCVRVRGGLVERLRFFHLTGPAITRKQDLEGRAVKSDADLRVVSIEPLPDVMRLYDITTGTGDEVVP